METAFPHAVSGGILGHRAGAPPDVPEKSTRGVGDVLAITSSAVEVSPDKQGRILVPAWLQEAAGLDGRVLLVGNIDRVELWHPDEFDRVARTGSGEFAKFSNQIFG